MKIGKLLLFGENSGGDENLWSLQKLDDGTL